METLFHSTSFSLSPNKPLSFTLNIHKPHCKIYRCASSRLPTISASSSKKPRVRKKVRSNEEVCNDIREFMTEFQFPEDHFPTIKELLQHGRQDLAFIVRRRGYKHLTELMATSIKTNSDGCDRENDSAGEQDVATAGKVDQQDEKLKIFAKLSNDAPITQDDSSRMDFGSEFTLDDKNSISIESSTKLSLQEKVAKFIQKGELNTIEDGGFDISNKSIAEKGKGYIGSEITTENLESSSLIEEQSSQVLCGNNAANLFHGTDVLQHVEPSSEHGTSRNGCFSSDGLSSASDNQDVEARKKGNEVEINHLKFMLHQKELELAELKQQIEKEQLALSILQTKAETEMNNAQKLLSHKDAELLSAEETLSGLEEVQIQYCSDGESVEVAGSFNGWHQRIKMDPQPSSSIMDPLGSRKLKLWRTVLWLYPGVYEIKFVVDGHWRTDPERDSVTKGTIQNNILRVGR